MMADLVHADKDRVVAYGLYSAAISAASVLAGLLAAVVGGIDLLLLFVIDAVPLLTTGPAARLDPFRAMALGFVLLGAGFAFNGLADSLSGFILATVVWSLGDILLLGRAHALIAAIGPAPARGRYMAAYGVTWGIAAVVSPPLGTQLISSIGVTCTWASFSVAALLLGVAHLIVGKLTFTQSRIGLNSQPLGA
ncbi:hypothetical protein KEM60_03063 [Austwickia sp. TVS 96-490-7B]|uniref:hypothetical protein n=1 Tax=Austwickia sp. TVS 96-490-7B TaxID=2830843 RepID=UPI001C57F5DE|nr:hypothetical protein [Austwickia sp. TVS 96-490-7B]MBW3086834.1 hypothetical protein [Austwickia sp. TVS 96-490-7B]